MDMAGTLMKIYLVKLNLLQVRRESVVNEIQNIRDELKQLNGVLRQLRKQQSTQ